MRFKTLLACSLLFNVLLLAYESRNYYYSHFISHPSAPVDNWFIQYNELRTSVFEGLPLDSTDIVFVGNSLTEGFPFSETFHNPHIKNRGIGSNRTYQIVNRLPKIIAAHPRKIFLEMGTNDILHNIPTDSILYNYRTAISMIQQGSPLTKIYIHSIFPTSLTHKELNPTITRVNDSLIYYCNNYHIQYINVYKDLYKDGGLDTSITVDGIHLKENGYDIWKNDIKEFLQQ